MALAEFFDKAALAASQVLQGFDRAHFEDTLNSRPIGVAFDDSAVCSREGMTTLELTVNLLSRLYPRIAIVPSGTVSEEATEHFVSLARSINPKIDIERSLEGADICLAVGDSVVTGAARIVYIGSDGWVTRVSTSGPRGTGATDNPFGAAAAACFGAANGFRAVFSPQLPNGGLDEDFSVSLLDYDPASPEPYNPELGSVNLGESYLAGLGAIGNGMVWALSRVPGLRGELHLVDHEEVDLTSLQRYVLTKMVDVGTSKVALTQGLLRSKDLKVHAHPERWGAYLAARDDWNLEQVAVAVDSAEDRRAVQAALPRWTVNAWTQPGDLGISRHGFLDDHACLMCLYLPEGEQKNEDEIVAEAIGLSDCKQEVRQRLYLGTPNDRQFLERVATAKGIDLGQLVPFEGKTLRDLYVEGVCGGAVLGLSDGSADDARAEVPMAFQSALAGIMLAAELVAHADEIKDTPPPVETRLNLLRPVAKVLSFPVAKNTSEKCICQDVDYVSAYRTKYSGA